MRRRTRARFAEPKLDMSSMIDVVFLLLIFFVATITTQDLMAHLDVSRPGPEKDITDEPVEPPPTFNIEVLKEGYAVNKARHSLSYIEQCLTRQLRYNNEQHLIVICYEDSPHERLVRLLDLCAKHGMKNIALMSR